LYAYLWCPKWRCELRIKSWFFFVISCFIVYGELGCSHFTSFSFRILHPEAKRDLLHSVFASFRKKKMFFSHFSLRTFSFLCFIAYGELGCARFTFFSFCYFASRSETVRCYYVPDHYVLVCLKRPLITTSLDSLRPLIMTSLLKSLILVTMSLVRYVPCLERPWVFTIFVRYVPYHYVP
jgi:hypothetical protein